MYKDHPIINAEPYHRELYLLIMWMVVLNHKSESDETIKALEDLTVALGESCEAMQQKYLKFDESLLNDFIDIYRSKEQSLWWLYDILIILGGTRESLEADEYNIITKLIQYLELNSTILKVVFYYIEQKVNNLDYASLLNSSLIEIRNDYTNIVLNQTINLAVTKLENDTLYYNCMINSQKRNSSLGGLFGEITQENLEYIDVELNNSDNMFLHCKFDIGKITLSNTSNVVYLKCYYKSLEIIGSSNISITKNTNYGYVHIQDSNMIELISNDLHSSTVENKVHNSNDIKISKNNFTGSLGSGIERLIPDVNRAFSGLGFMLGLNKPNYAMSVYQSKRITCADNIIEKCLEPGIYIDNDNINVSNTNNKCSNMYNDSTDFN